MVEKLNDYIVPEEVRKKLGDYIKERREKLGIGLNQISVKTEVANSLWSRLENGKVLKINPFLLKKIGEGLKINYKELYKIVGYLDEDKNEIVGNIDLEVGYKKVPLYSSISAGYGACDSGVIDYIALPMVNSFSGDIFAVRVNGDSMEHTIENHSIVFIKRDSEVANKKIGAFLLNNEALLKRYYVTENGVFLRSDNRDYPDIRVREHDDFIVVGRYIGSVINEDEI